MERTGLNRLRLSPAQYLTVKEMKALEKPWLLILLLFAAVLNRAEAQDSPLTDAEYKSIK